MSTETLLARVPLRLALPLTLLLLVATILGLSMANAFWQRTHQTMTQARTDMVALGARLARAATRDLATDPRRVEADVTHAATDPRLRVVAVLDPQGRVLLANRSEWKGRPATLVLPGFDGSTFARVAAGGRPHHTGTDNGTHATVLVPYAPPAPDEALRDPRNGVIFLAYDLGAQRAQIRTQVLRARAPELAATVVLALLMGWALHRLVARPLQGLRDASRRAALGDFSSSAPIAGLAEVADLGRAFNTMARRLDTAISNLRASEEQLAVTLHSIGDALIATDLAGQITLMNPVAEELTRWSLAEARGQPVANVFRIVDARSGEPADIPVERALADGAVVGLGNHTVLIARDGTRRHIADSAAPIRDGQGQMFGVVMVFRDVTREYTLREALRESEQHFRTLANSGQALIWTADTQGRCDSFNQVWLDFTGRSLSEELGDGWTEGVHPDDLGDCLRQYRAALQRRERFSLVYRLRRHDGEYRWLLDEGMPRYDSHGEYVGYIGHCLDITDRRRMEAEMAQRREELEAIFRALPDLFFRIDAQGVITDYKARDIGELYLPPEEFLGRPLHELLPSEAVARYQAALAQSRASGEPSTYEYALPMPDGSRWFEARINRLGTSDEAVVLVRDVSERKRAEAEIHRLAYFDALTGLPNRRLMMDRLSQALAVARRGGHVGALMFIDLDQFKRVNDARGHEVGDAVLRQVGERLKRFLRNEDTVARLGGDEFVVLLVELANTHEAAARLALAVADKIRGVLRTPFDVDGVDYHIGASIGITVFPKNGEREDDLLREADTAMYRAKEAGRNAVIYFETAMQEHVRARLALEQDLHRAIAARELCLYLQPQIDRHGRLVGAEALVRWRHPERGLIPPAAFIPVAEESGLIVALGDWVLAEAATLLRALQDARLALRLAVNLSPRQFRQSGFVAHVRDVLAAAGADPTSLVLEVTESLMIEDIHDTIAKMAQLSALGIHFSVDDFGTGYSSLAYLKRLPLNELKIDRTFVQDAPDDANDAALVETILSVARHLGLRVVAEGVESEAQREFLAIRGCDVFQGHRFDHPMPWRDFLAKWRAGASDADIHHPGPTGETPT